MKKIFFFFAVILSVQVFSQTKLTADQAERSSDPKVIANFIKNNPNDPKTPFLKQKLAAIVLSDQPKAERAAAAKPKVAPLDVKKMETVVKKDVATNGEVSEKHRQTAALLTHLFNNDPNARDAYIQIVNKSACNLVVKISGKKFYNLNVPPNNSNYIMVDKGSYTLTTMVCDAKYSSVKQINKDIVITLNK